MILKALFVLINAITYATRKQECTRHLCLSSSPYAAQCASTPTHFWLLGQTRVSAHAHVSALVFAHSDRKDERASIIFSPIIPLNPTEIESLPLSLSPSRSAYKPVTRSRCWIMHASLPTQSSSRVSPTHAQRPGMQRIALGNAIIPVLCVARGRDRKLRKHTQSRDGLTV